MWQKQGMVRCLKNTKSGTYTIVVDLNRLDVNIVSIYPLPQDGIWIVGDASTIGWDWGKMKRKVHL